MQKQSLSVKPLFCSGHHPKTPNLRVRQLVCRQSPSPEKFVPTALPTASLRTTGGNGGQSPTTENKKPPGKADSKRLWAVNVESCKPTSDDEWRPQGKPQATIECGLQRYSSRFAYDFAYNGIWRGVQA